MITRRRRTRRQDGTEIALANFALTFAKALLVFCVALFLLIDPKPNNDGVKPKAEYLISVDWVGKDNDDVDTWVRTPDGSRVSYSTREANVVYLERDDLGNNCSATTNNGQSTDACEEIVVIRGIVTGPYGLSLHLYSHDHSVTPQPLDKPLDVHVKIEKLNPDVRTVWETHTNLSRIREEKPLVRFISEADGKLSGFETTGLEPIVYGNPR